MRHAKKRAEWENDVRRLLNDMKQLR